jgi:opacity protein-like surface antigen
MRQGKRRFSLAAVAFSAILPAGCALAADFPVKAPPAAPAFLDWSGVYLGVHAGYGGGMKDWDLGSDFVASGALIGGQIGINKQLGSLVFGLELDGSWANFKGSQFESQGGPLFGGTSSAAFASKIDGMATLAARAGLAADRWFVFAKAGAATAHERHSLDANFAAGGATIATFTASGNETRWGPMIGFGAEYALAGNWTLKGEYNYLHFGVKDVAFDITNTFGGVTTTGVAPAQIEQAIHLVKFGANYRLGGPSSEPYFAPVPPAPGTNWSGAYIGAQGGYAGERETWPDFTFMFTGLPGSSPTRSDSWLAGFDGGVNAQAGSFVFGVEGEWMWTGLKASQTATSPFFGPGSTGSVTAETRIDWLAIASARAGFVVGDKLLVYGKAGVAIANEKHSVSLFASDPVFGTISGSESAKAIHTGGVIGLGAEYAFASNWSAKIEYDYLRMLGQYYTATGGIAVAGLIGTGTINTAQPFDRMSQDLHLVKFGVNYHFSPTPVVTARY